MKYSIESKSAINAPGLKEASATAELKRLLNQSAYSVLDANIGRPIL